MDSANRWGDETNASGPSGLPAWVKILLLLLLIVAVASFVVLVPRSPAPISRPVPESPAPISPDPLGLILPPVAAEGRARPKFDDPQPEPGAFAGIESCRECHAERVAEFQQTSHFLTSRPATSDSVLGHFGGQNDLLPCPSADNLRIVMERREGGLWQSAIVEHQGEQYVYSRPLDVVTGSGKIAQTYLFWEDSRLYELPASYSTTLARWVHSPGYQDTEARFARNVVPSCMRCHATYMQEGDKATNHYVRETIIYGVTCERCHGGGTRHVQFQRAADVDRTLASDPIVKPATLSRQRQLEICTQCHGGNGRLLKPAFAYQAGKPLSVFIQQETEPGRHRIGMHTTNQLARLKLSSCFLNDQGMTCTTCHDPHHRERADTQLFSQRCQQCHEASACPPARRLGKLAEENCIDCHLPKAQDLDVPLQGGGELTFPEMRDHWIRIGRELSETIERKWRDGA